MIDFKAIVTFYPRRVEKAAEKANFENLGHVGASIRKDAAKSIKRRKRAHSPPGKPPHTRNRGFFRRALAFDVNKRKDEVIIGFRASVIGDIGNLHEFGGTRDGAVYPARPTVGPALERAEPRIGSQWKGTIGA